MIDKSQTFQDFSEHVLNKLSGIKDSVVWVADFLLRVCVVEIGNVELRKLLNKTLNDGCKR